jgi:hypothetical protein
MLSLSFCTAIYIDLLILLPKIVFFDIYIYIYTPVEILILQPIYLFINNITILYRCNNPFPFSFSACLLFFVI